jgi:hypothetical protein
MFAREGEDKDSGKHLHLNHPWMEGLDRSTNHRFGPTAAMILLLEHPAAGPRQESRIVEIFVVKLGANRFPGIQN